MAAICTAIAGLQAIEKQAPCERGRVLEVRLLGGRGLRPPLTLILSLLSCFPG